MHTTRHSTSGRKHGETAPTPPLGIDSAETEASAASTRKSITSAAALASDSDAFVTWARMVKLVLTIQADIPVGARFDLIRNLKKRSNMFPAWLKNPLSDQFRYIPPGHIYWRDRLCTLIQPGKGPYSDDGRDDPCFPNAVCNVFQICQHQRMVQEEGLHSETDVRYLLDTLLACICEDGTDRSTHYFTERTLRLPDCTTDKAKVTTTMVDGAMAIRIADLEPYLSNSGLQQAVSTIVGASTQVLRVLHCPAEFKSVLSGENQMKMAMASALHQKKALGMLGQFVF
ncbi:unnamed protein product, partial [Rhizoctonia solani]